MLELTRSFSFNKRLYHAKLDTAKSIIYRCQKLFQKLNCQNCQQQGNCQMWYQRLMSYSLSSLLLQWWWSLLLSGLCPYSAMLKVNLIIVRVVVICIYKSGLDNKIKSQSTKFVYLLLHSNYSHLWCSRTFYQQHSYHCLLVLILFRWQCMILLHSAKI